MQEASDEEREHAEMLMKYQNRVGGWVHSREGATLKHQGMCCRLCGWNCGILA
jgi:hypothetical protein